jgi:hypothetical protein
MSHRLLALVLAALIGAAPVAPEICELSCVEHHPGSTTSGHAHHDHQHNASGTADTSSNASVSTGMHGCRHEVESQPISITVKLDITAPGFAFHGVDPAAALVSTVALSSAIRIAGLTPVPISLRTPLRI